MLNSVTERKTFEWKSLSTLNVLPYQNDNDVYLKKNSNMGDAMLLNNSLRRFVDNDLYNEQLILNIKEGRNVPGATVTALSHVVIDSAENHKFALTSIADISEDHPYQIVIGKKKIADNDDQVSSVEYFEGQHVNFYIYDGRKWVVGTKDGIHCSGDRLSDWHRVGERGDDYLLADFKSQDCRCCIRNQYQGLFKNKLDKYEFFLGVGDGVWGLNTTLEFGESVAWERVHTTLIGITPNRMYLDKKERCLFVCTSTGLYKCTGDECIRERKTYKFDIPSMAAMEDEKLSLANERLLIATDEGIRQSTNAYFPTSVQKQKDNFLIQHKEPGKTEEKSINVTCLGLTPDRTHVKFFGTENGLRHINQTHINDEPEYYASNTADVSKKYIFGIEYEGNHLYAGYRGSRTERAGTLVVETSPGSKNFEVVKDWNSDSAFNKVKDIFHIPFDCLLVTTFDSSNYLYIVDTNEFENYMYPVEGYDAGFGEPNSVTVHGQDIYVASTNGIHIFKVERNFYVRLDKKSWMYNKNILYARKSNVPKDDTAWVSYRSNTGDREFKTFVTNSNMDGDSRVDITTTIGGTLNLVTPVNKNSYYFTVNAKNGLYWSDNKELSNFVLTGDDRRFTFVEPIKNDDEMAFCLTKTSDNKINVEVVFKSPDNDLASQKILEIGSNLTGNIQIKYASEQNKNLFAVFNNYANLQDGKSKLSVFSFLTYESNKYSILPYDELNLWIGNKSCTNVTYNEDDIAIANYGNKSWISGTSENNAIVANWLIDEQKIPFLDSLTPFIISARSDKPVVVPYETNYRWITSVSCNPENALRNLVGMERIYLSGYSGAIAMAAEKTLQIWKPVLGVSYLSIVYHATRQDDAGRPTAFENADHDIMHDAPKVFSSNHSHLFTDNGVYEFLLYPMVQKCTTHVYPPISQGLTSYILTETDLPMDDTNITYHVAGLSGGEFAWFYNDEIKVAIEGKSILDMSNNTEMANAIRDKFNCTGVAMPRFVTVHEADGSFYRNSTSSYGLWEGTFNNRRFIPFFLVGSRVNGTPVNKVYFADGDMLDWKVMSIDNEPAGTSAKDSLNSNTVGRAIAVAGTRNYVLIAAKDTDGKAQIKYLKLDSSILNNNILKSDDIANFNSSLWKPLVSATEAGDTISHMSIIEKSGCVFGTAIVENAGYMIKETSSGLSAVKLESPNKPNTTSPVPVESIFCQGNIIDSGKVQFFTYAFDDFGHLRIRGWEVSKSETSTTYTSLADASVDVPNDTDRPNRKVLALYDSFTGDSNNFFHYIFIISQNGNNEGVALRTEIITRGYRFKKYNNQTNYGFEPRLIEQSFDKNIRRIAASVAPKDTSDENKKIQFFAVLLEDSSVRLFSSKHPSSTLTDYPIGIGEMGEYLTIKDVAFGTIKNGNEYTGGLNLLCESSNGSFLMQFPFSNVTPLSTPVMTSTGMFGNLTVNNLGRTSVDALLFALTTDVPKSIKIPDSTVQKVINVLLKSLWHKDFGFSSYGYKVETVDFYTKGNETYVIGVDNNPSENTQKRIATIRISISESAITTTEINNEFPEIFKTWRVDTSERDILFMRGTSNKVRTVGFSAYFEPSSSTRIISTTKDYKEIQDVGMSFLEAMKDTYTIKNPIEDYYFFNNSGMWRWLPKVEIKPNPDKGDDGHIVYLTEKQANDIRTGKETSADYGDFDIAIGGKYDCSYCALWDEELEDVDETGKHLSTTHYMFTFDFEVYAINFSFLSSDIESFCFQLPRKCDGVETLADGNYLFNLGSELKVIDIVANRMINLELEDLDTMIYYTGVDSSGNSLTAEVEPVNCMYPLKMGDANNFFLIANNGLLAKVINYHKERCFEHPRGDYKILDKRFFDRDIRSLFRITDRDLIVGTHDFGTYMVRNLAICTSYLDQSGNVLKGNSECITSVLQDASKEYATKYLFSSGDKIYNTLNTVNSEPEITCLPSGCNVNFLCAENDTQYAMCTNMGLYITELHWDIEDELHRFSIESVSALAADEVEILLYNHIRNYHQLDEFWKTLYRKAPSNLNKVPAGFTTPEGVDLNNAVKTVFDDVVASIEFNDSNKYIKASVRNWATDQLKGEAVYSTDNYIDRLEFRDKVYDLSEIPYTCKFWESGMLEFMIYVPTTLTFYMNNPRGFSNSQYSGQSINRPNIEQNYSVDNTVPQRYTSMRLILNNEHFGIRTINEIQINGNSLPLKIYKDNTYCQEGRENLFDSVIQPSLVVSMPHIVVSSNDTQNNVNSLDDGVGTLTLEFAIYGTDAQSIRILANK